MLAHPAETYEPEILVMLFKYIFDMPVNRRLLDIILITKCGVIKILQLMKQYLFVPLVSSLHY